MVLHSITGQFTEVYLSLYGDFGSWTQSLNNSLAGGFVTTYVQHQSDVDTNPGNGNTFGNALYAHLHHMLVIAPSGVVANI